MISSRFFFARRNLVEPGLQARRALVPAPLVRRTIGRRGMSSTPSSEGDNTAPGRGVCLQLRGNIPEIAIHRAPPPIPAASVVEKPSRDARGGWRAGLLF